MAFGEYRVPHISNYLLAQDTEVTCWAACAATLVSKRRGVLVTEINALPNLYRSWYTNARTVSRNEIRQVYTALHFRESHIDVNSRPALVQFIRTNAPIIVASSIVSFGVSVQHHGYHVRVITGYWGDPESSDEDALQIRIFDPAPPPGFLVETPFLFSHFRYQMGLQTGPVPGLVGSCWYL